MKHFYLIIAGLLMISTMSFSQEPEFVISLQGKKIVAKASMIKNKNLIVLDSKNKSEKYFLKIDNKNFASETEWNRTYKIYTNTDSLVLDVLSKNAITEIFYEELISVLKKKGLYNVYTISIPKDPNIAATVRVARMFLCAIEVK